MPIFSMYIFYRPDGFENDWSKQQIAKFKCILNYFERVTNKEPLNNVTFYRRQLNILKRPDWMNSPVTFSNQKLEIFEEGFIEDAHDAAQVDFANMFLGGGVLERGCVQEEIRFSISTECLAGMLFCARMKEDECVIIKGAERYSNLKGYARTLEYDGNYMDAAGWDDKGRKEITIIAIDAISFMGNDVTLQFSETYVMREVNKAYCGFVPIDASTPIATGNWGCGAFLGNLQLKAMIQLVAAAQAGRDVKYFTFNSPDVNLPLLHVHNLLKQKGITVGQVLQAILKIGSTKELFKELTSYLGGVPASNQPHDEESAPLHESESQPENNESSTRDVDGKNK